MNKLIFSLAVSLLVSCSSEKSSAPYLKYSHFNLITKEVVSEDSLYMQQENLEGGGVLLYYSASKESVPDPAGFLFELYPEQYLKMGMDTACVLKHDTVFLENIVAPITVFDYNVEDLHDEESHIFVYKNRIILIHNWAWSVAGRFDFDENTKKINNHIIERLWMK